MEPFIKYMTPSLEDKNWGLYLNCVGKVDVEPGSAYPLKSHPSNYYFTFGDGRILNEYQINYITDGEGIYENRNDKYRIRPGTLLITRPGDWHRYRPEMQVGWTEYYVGFAGRIADQIFRQSWFRRQINVLPIGNREEIIDTYDKIFEFVREAKPGYQQVASGMVMKLLGFIVSMDMQKKYSGERVARIIQDACFKIREHIETEMDFEEFAQSKNIGYSYFRKMFKKYTGMPPLQYHLELKVMRAKEMLLYTDMNVKAISYKLGFQSIYYFSRFFKKKLGVSPSEMRKTAKA